MQSEKSTRNKMLGGNEPAPGTLQVDVASGISVSDQPTVVKKKPSVAEGGDLEVNVEERVGVSEKIGG
jgi:hypothetical protein